MKTVFARNMIISAGAHVLVIVLLLTLSFYSCRARRSPREITTFIDFQAVPPEDTAPPAVDMPAPVSTPAPQPKPMPKKIEVSRTIVKRDPAPAPLTAQDILKTLKKDDPPPRQVASGDEFAHYLAGVRTVLYNAWRQPQGLAGTPVTQAQIRVQRDGLITQRKIIVSSGNKAMDESVMRALESVTRLSRLPPECGEREDITIAFELTGPA